MLHRLTFDSTDATSISNSHKVFSALISSDGATPITDTTVGPDTGMDVNIINTSLTTTISGDVNVTQGTSPWVVSATDLDIRDLTAASDSVQSNLFDGAGTALTSTLVGADQSLDVNITQSVALTVSATDLDIRDLSASQDNVAISDGTDTLAIESDGSINTNATIAAPNTAVLATATALASGGTADPIVSSALANRKSLRFFNNSNKDLFFGQDGVTSANGYPVPPGSELTMQAGPSIVFDFVGGTTGQEARILEIS